MPIEDNQSYGYVKVYRSMKEHWLWLSSRKKTKLEAWIDLLMMANHKPNKLLFGHELKQVNRGEFITSQETLSKEWNWDRSTVSKFLKCLQDDGMIIVKSSSKCTQITICNYASYNDSATTKQQQNNSVATSKQHKQ